MAASSLSHRDFWRIEGPVEHDRGPAAQWISETNASFGVGARLRGSGICCTEMPRGLDASFMTATLCASTANSGSSSRRLFAVPSYDGKPRAHSYLTASSAVSFPRAKYTERHERTSTGELYQRRGFNDSLITRTLSHSATASSLGSDSTLDNLHERPPSALHLPGHLASHGHLATRSAKQHAARHLAHADNNNNIYTDELAGREASWPSTVKGRGLTSGEPGRRSMRLV